MKHLLIIFFNLLYLYFPNEGLLFAQESNCSISNAASKRIQELIPEILNRNFTELKETLESSWSKDKKYEDYLISALRDLESYKSFSKNLVLQKICSKGDSVADGYYLNELTKAVDRIHLEVELSSVVRIRKIIPYRADQFTDIPKQKLIDTQRIQNLESYVNYLTNASAFSGVVLIAKDGKIIYQKAFGERFADLSNEIELKDPFDPEIFTKLFQEANTHPMIPIKIEDVFNLASMNKIITATAILQLIEKGKINLEDPVVKYLPDEIMSEEGRTVKLKHLLSHTSGIGNNFDKLSFKPGSKFKYNNMNFAYLGEIIERVTGMRYEDYLRINILGPLGMASTARFELKQMTSSIVIGDYEDIRNGKYVLVPNPYLQKYPGSAMGGLYSTAEDLFKFGEALRGGKLLSPESVNLMRTAKSELNAPEYGYGVMLWQGPGIWGHSGRLPGADADLEIYGNTGYVAVVLANKTEANPPVLAKIRSLFFPQSLNKK